MIKFISIQHPDLGPGSRTKVSKKAFEAVWSDKGWVLAEEAMADETLAELRTEAAKADIKGRSSMDKDELVAALAPNEQEDQPE